MQVLIVGADPGLAQVWANHLVRSGAEVTVADGQDPAIRTLQDREIDILVLDLDLVSGSALAVADYASYRWPDARILPVSRRGVFSDGSIFAHVPNVCSYVQATTSPEDLAAIVQHYGAHGRVTPSRAARGSPDPD